MEASGVPVLGVGQIPIDYMLRKSLIGHGLTVYDAQGNVVFRIGPSSSSARRTKILFDSVGNPLVTVLYLNDEWRCFRGNSQELEDLIFTVHKILYSPSNTELDVLLSSADSSDQKTGFRLKGNPFRRACTIIRGDSIVAQAASRELQDQPNIRFMLCRVALPISLIASTYPVPLPVDKYKPCPDPLLPEVQKEPCHV